MILTALPTLTRRLRFALVGIAIAGGVLRSAEPVPSAPLFAGPFAAGTLESPPRRETSGLAVSRRAADILWTHDDSGGAPVLYAIDTTGKKRGDLRLRGVKNEDWEDLASFEQNGTAWLLIADTGDNDAQRATVLLHLLEEPPPDRLDPERELSAPPAYSIRIRYEDGSRDCESVGVDVANQAIYLLTKRDGPPRLYRAPLGVPRQQIVIARFVGALPHLEGNSDTDTMLKMLVGKKVAWPTAMDFAADGQTAAVLTYGGVLVFTRQAKQTWIEALSGVPSRLTFHGLTQAEAVCFSADARTLYVASEGVAGFARYNREVP